jgi:dTDP-4-dehydrorhamnose reductase
MKVLLLGGSGQLGREIQAGWTDCDIFAPAHESFDLATPHTFVHSLDAYAPDVVVNCAAFHNVDVCEHEPAAALAINAVAVDALAAACERRGCEFVTISTDYVFDGDSQRPYTEHDVPNPISAYGISKLAGELFVRKREMRAYVVRTCGVYGVHASRSKGTFVDRVIAQARAGERPRVVSDVTASPTFAGHLSVALRSLVRSGAYGIYHMVNEGAVSWFDFAREALRQAGVDDSIEAISSTDWKTVARRPRYSALSNSALASIGVRMPSWREGVSEYLARRERS